MQTITKQTNSIKKIEELDNTTTYENRNNINEQKSLAMIKTIEESTIDCNKAIAELNRAAIVTIGLVNMFLILALVVVSADFIWNGLTKLFAAM